MHSWTELQAAPYFHWLISVIHSCLWQILHFCLQPLEDRLDEYAEDKSLTGKKPFVASFPPDFEPIPCRPLFFDLALNHVDFPSLDDKLEQTQKKAAGGGLTGLVKGWLWGGGDKK